MKQSVSIIITAVLLTGCASVPEKNPNDPYERYNRTMFKFNDKADEYVMKPVARGYEKIVPQFARTGVSNFFDNLRDVVSLGSNVLRGDLNKAGTDLVRVTVNSTVGLGGLINIADKEGIPSNKNTLGDTFASWGWKKSNYFVFPLTGPSTVRDSVGSTIVSVAPLENAIIHDKIARYTLTGVKAVDTRVKYLPLTDMMEKTETLDKYAYMRDMYMAARNKQIGVQTETEEVDIEDLMGDDDSTTLPENTSPEVITPNSKPNNKTKQTNKISSKTKQHWQQPADVYLGNVQEWQTDGLSPFSQK